jgi:hypothetical protein
VMPQINPGFPRSSTKTRLTWLLMVVLALFAGSGSFVLAQQKAGYVLEIEGKWTIRGTAESLSMGQSVAGGIRLTNPDPSDGDHIVVANLHGEIVKTIRCKNGVCRECREPGACYDPIQPLPSISGSTSTISTVFNAVLELFAGKPDRYSVHRVRGSGFVIARNAVVRLEGSAVDVSEFLEGQEKGSYDFQFIPLSGDGSGKKELKANINLVNLSSQGKAALVIEGIQPGLYEMQITRGGDTSSAWVLLCNAASCPASAASFQAFVRQTDSWGTGVTQATKKAYQRAYLEYLAMRIPGSIQ